MEVGIQIPVRTREQVAAYLVSPDGNLIHTFILFIGN